MPEEFDLGSAIDSVAESVAVPSTPSTPAADASPSMQTNLPAAAGGPAPGPVGRPLPKAWKKEMEAHWGKLPPEIHDYVYEREGNVSRGIAAYKEGHENWTQLLDPYKQVLAQYPDVNPRVLLNNLLQTHLAMSFADDEGKQQLAQQLLESYGVNLSGQQPPSIDPRFVQRIDNLERSLQQQRNTEALNYVQRFFADPKNKYAKELENDILQLVQRGFSLEDAYNTAIWTNEAVRAKQLAEQNRAAPGADALNVESPDGGRKPPAPRKGTMDDTINAVVAKHFSNPH